MAILYNLLKTKTSVLRFKNRLCFHFFFCLLSFVRNVLLFKGTNVLSPRDPIDSYILHPLVPAIARFILDWYFVLFVPQMVQFVSTRIPNFLLQSCFKWVTATKVAWLSKLLGMRAACILAFSTSSPAAARQTIPSGLGSGDGRGCSGCRKVSLGRHPGARQPHCACSLQCGRGSSSLSAVPAAPRPLRAAGCRSGRASGVSTHSHGASASCARSPRPPPGTGEGHRSGRPGTKGLGGGRGPPGDLPPCAWNVPT